MFRRIYNFVFDFIEYVLLLILLIIASVLIVSNDNPDVRSLQAEVASVFKFVCYPYLWIHTLDGLVDENKQLEQENIQLKMLNVQFKEAWLENQRLSEMLDFMEQTKLDIIPAKVLNQGVTPVYNSLLLRGGKDKGIEPYNAVITSRGIVGKTIAVGETSTVVHMLNDVNFRLGVRFQNSRHTGVLEPRNDQMGLIKEIPKTTEIEIDEQVLTSGFSDIFPKGIPVGYVIKIEEIKNSTYKNVVIKFYVNVNTIEEVFIVRKQQ